MFKILQESPGSLDHKSSSLSVKGLNKASRRGVQSSIPIAAAIAGYSAISMFQFMNIPDNPLLYMDTDSAVLSLN